MSTKHGDRRKKNSVSCWWCGACGHPYDWKPHCLLTFEIGDTANEQVVFTAYGALDGECYKMISALKLVTNLIKGNKLGVEVKRPYRKQSEQTCGCFVVVHFGGEARAFVTMGELAQFKEVHKTVPPNFNKAIYKDAEVVGGEEILTIRPEEQMFAKTLCGYVKDPERCMETVSDGGGRAVLCEAPNQSIKEEQEWLAMHKKQKKRSPTHLE